MGCGASKKFEGGQHDKDVRQMLATEEIRALTHFKVLLLGAGESGKSTVIKQLKVYHKHCVDPILRIGSTQSGDGKARD
jgi:hypothetical protein